MHVEIFYDNNTKEQLTFDTDGCLYYQGVECGDKPVQHWFETRFVVKESSEFSPYGLVLDTIEVAIPWERANELYNTVVERVMKLPGVIMVSGHASHFYTTGVCFYFTFTAVPEENQSPLDLYNLCWDTTVATTLECGGAISHHHGIGIKTDFFWRFFIGRFFIFN